MLEKLKTAIYEAVYRYILAILRDEPNIIDYAEDILMIAQEAAFDAGIEKEEIDAIKLNACTDACEYFKKENN